MRLVYETNSAEVKPGDEIILASGYWRKVRTLPPTGHRRLPCEDIDGFTIQTPLASIGAHWIEQEEQPCLF